jgi:hypothetical protein
VNTHAQVDTHIADGTLHYIKSSIDIGDLGDVSAAAPNDDDVLTWDAGGATWQPEAASAGIGGSTGGTDNALLRADGVGGSTLQNSVVTMTDTGDTTFPSGADVQLVDGHFSMKSNKHIRFGANLSNNNYITLFGGDNIGIYAANIQAQTWLGSIKQIQNHFRSDFLPKTSVIGTANPKGSSYNLKHDTNAVVADARALQVLLSNQSTGTITNAYALRIETIVNSGGGTVTNGYGLKIEDQTVATNDWAIKTGVGKHDFGDLGNFSVAGLRTQVSTDNVSDPPTDAELDAAFDTPANLGAGFIGIVDDNSGDTDVWLCYTSDTSWYYLQGTKAV